MPLARVALPLSAGAAAWISVGEVACIYTFDGELFRAASVSIR